MYEDVFMEIEFKFYIPESLEIQEIKDDAFWQLFPLKSWKEERQIAHYFRDQDNLLHTRGIALRLRQEGSQKILTAKLKTEMEGTYSEREEHAVIWPKNIPSKDECIHAFLHYGLDENHILIRTLHEIQGELIADMISDVIRHEVDILDTNNHFVLSMDEGYLQVDSIQEKCYELEIEYKLGSKQQFTNFAHTIQSHFRLISPSENKYTRLQRLRSMSHE